MKPGETFKPAGLRAATNGKVYPPALVDRQKGVNDLGDGEKRLYRSLYNRALMNADGVCWPSFGTLAFDLGKCERTVRTEAANLEKLCLIARDRSNRRAATVYTFPWHAMFNNSAHGPADERQTVTAQTEAETEEQAEVERQTVTAQTPEVERQIGDVDRQIQDSCAANSRQLCGKQLPHSISVVSRELKQASQLASLLAEYVGAMQEAYQQSAFGHEAITPSLLERILAAAGAQSEDDVHAFGRFVRQQFMLPDRRPGFPKGPRGLGLLVNWAADWREVCELTGRRMA